MAACRDSVIPTYSFLVIKASVSLGSNISARPQSHSVSPIDIGGVLARTNISNDPIYIATHQHYPSVYSDNINSALTFTNLSSDSLIRLKFSARSGIALESNCHDYLNITGVSGYENNTLQICGTNVSQSMLYLKLTGSSVSFRFVSDYNQSFAGFIMEYSEVDEIWSNERKSSADIEVVPIQQGLNTTARTKAKSIMHIVTHKGYPTIPYDNNLNSSLHLIGLSAQLLYRITVTARSGIELEKNCSDYIASLENNLGIDSLCASDVDESTYYLTPFESTTLTFITSQEQSYKGLLLVYSAVLPIYLEKNFDRRVSSEALTHIATHMYYPLTYDNNINAALTFIDIPVHSHIRLDFTAQTNIALEGNCLDYLTINGVTGYGNNVTKICGTDAPQTTLYLRTTGDSVTFRFITDKVEVFAGFVMEFSVIYPAETTETTSTTAANPNSLLVTIDTTVSATLTHFAFVTVISLLILIIIILAALLAVLRRKLTL
ncbi:uncharacterized protein [Watersipora subatra]|uniref:uncharacterized protein n=1 Tax=Watersipora subatra TaxID=2589382 RepID=UPI00355C5A5C